MRVIKADMSMQAMLWSVGFRTSLMSITCTQPASALELHV